VRMMVSCMLKYFYNIKESIASRPDLCISIK
jgi:hypothetical protein